MGGLLADLVRHDAWALWLAAPAVGIAVVCLGVWWVSRPARPATTSRSIAGHHAYLEALTRGPRERVAPPPLEPPAPPPAPERPVVLDATVLDGDTAADGAETGGPAAVTLHA